MDSIDNSLNTPVYNSKDLVDVYEPSEDTFLFIDALEKELSSIITQKPSFVLEIGSGSGVITAALATKLRSATAFFTTDINIKACQATKLTAGLNKVHIESVCMNLASQFRAQLFDILIFNPPYVVTDSCEVQGNGLNRAWAGGVNGREIIDKLIPNVYNLLADGGVFYFLLLLENKPEEIVSELENRGFISNLIMERKILGEHLFIYKFIKAKI